MMTTKMTRTEKSRQGGANARPVPTGLGRASAGCNRPGPTINLPLNP